MVFTIGYDGRTPDGLVQALVRRGVECVVDVRYTAAGARVSRQFGRDLLARLCVDAGIRYVHLPALGVPSRDRKAERSSGFAGFRRRIRAALDDSLGGTEDAARARTDPTVAALRELVAAMEQSPTALLCAEFDPMQCHRNVLAEELASGMRQGRAELEIAHIT